MSEVKQSHPKGLYVLFVTEMWERFSYYGMRAIFVLFLTKALLYDKATASDGFYGSYTGLVYLTPLIGGYVADRYWGNRKSIIVGGFLMAIGQLFMFLSGSFLANVDLARILMLVGLTGLIIGNGFFKPNISTMVGQLYPKDDKRIDSAFTIFYMGINLGAFLSPIICGGLGDTGNPEDFKWGFLAACLGMILSTLLFIWLKDHYIVTPEGKPVGAKPNKTRETKDIDTAAEVKSEFTNGQIMFWLGVEVVLFTLFFFLKQGVIGSFIFSLSIAAPGFIISDRSLTKVERQRIWVIYIAAFFVIFFWAAFEQAGASLTFFAEEQTDRHIGVHISKTLISAIYGVLILLLAYFAFRVFKGMRNEQKGVRELILVVLLGGIGGLIYAIIKFPSEGSELDTIPASMFQSVNAIAIVIFAPIFSLMWTFLGKKRLEPASPFKQAIGLFLLALGYLVIAFGVKGIDASTKVSMMWLLSLYLIHTFGELCLSPIGLSMVNKLAPLKFASLLMGVWFLSTAAANKFAGTLSAYYPETMISVPAIESLQTAKSITITDKDKLEKAEEINGKKYLSVDLISFESVKDENEKAEMVKTVFADSIIKEKSFLGYTINSLYSFFMLFVVMAGLSSIILFIVSSKLLKMMHGVR
jgi:POT family proton-dependent oligopeptide transporter